MGDLPRGISRRRGGYRVQVAHEGRTCHIGDFQSLQVARDALNIARAEIARGVFVPPLERRRRTRERRAAEEEAERLEALHAVTVADYAAEWLARVRAERADGTARTYESAARRHILPALGGVRLVDLTQSDIDRTLERVPTRGARASVGRILRAMLRSAVAERAGGLASMPAVIRPPAAPTRGDVLDPSHIATPEQVRAIAEHMPPRLALAVILAAVCALRLGEVLGLQRSDLEGIDSGGPVTVHVRRQWAGKARGGGAWAPPKYGSGGAVAMPSQVADEVRAHLAAYVADAPGALLFPSPGDPSRPWSHTAAGRAWRQAREQVRGCERLRFHDLRHTGLTMYAREGATVAEIMARGRHRSPDVAARYQHATRERDRQTAERMGSAWGTPNR